MSPAAEPAIGFLTDITGGSEVVRDMDVSRSTEETLAAYCVNPGSTLTLLQVLGVGCRPGLRVHASPATVDGQFVDSPICEDAPKHSQSRYGTDRYAGELHVLVATCHRRIL